MEENKTKPKKQDQEGNLTAALTYAVGWITGLVFLLVEKEDQFVRFNAAQSLVLFGGFSILVLVPLLGQILGILLTLPAIVLWILLMVKAYKNERFELPVIQGLVSKVESSIK